LYGSGALTEWFQSEWPKHSSRKLDMGKGCVRFKKPEEVPFALIGELATKLTPQAWVEFYEKAIKSRPAR
jgi:large subunit ribosomal protein L31